MIQALSPGVARNRSRHVTRPFPGSPNNRRQRLNGVAFHTDVTLTASRKTGCRWRGESVSKA